MASWIEENAHLYGVHNKNKKVFEELASIANWNTKGGKAKSKTPPLENDKQSEKVNLTACQELRNNLPESLPLRPEMDDIPF